MRLESKLKMKFEKVSEKLVFKFGVGLGVGWVSGKFPRNFLDNCGKFPENLGRVQLIQNGPNLENDTCMQTV